MTADPTIVALADDLTGALEVGAKFSGAGIPAAVSVGGLPQAEERALVADTVTRHLTAPEAYRKVRAAAEAARGTRPRLVYKKTDSTLRGNIESELRALVDVFGGTVLYAPAYPRMGRTVRSGELFVDGIPVGQTEFARDALNPIRTSHIPSLLGDLVSCGAVEVVDGECDEDLRIAALRLLAAGGVRLAAGPAAFAEAIAEQLAPLRAVGEVLPVVRTALVVNGSRHEVSLGQVRRAEQQGWVTARTDGLNPSSWSILKTDEVVTGAGIERARSVGRMAREVLERLRPDALIVFGGDTAAGIVDALGNPVLYPVREVLPGMPLSSILGYPHLITKAGGFGGVDVLSELRILLEKEH